MDVFISWSGERSRAVAECLRNWLPSVIQAVKPWMSAEDISAGARWAHEIGNRLDATNAGIICLTPENQSEPWVMFEAGALSKTIGMSLVSPYLFALTTSQVSGPLSQFQAVVADRSGTNKLLETLNNALGGDRLTDDRLKEVFDVWWPKLETSLGQIPNEGAAPPRRSQQDILEEILALSREQLRRDDVRYIEMQSNALNPRNFTRLPTSALLHRREMLVSRLSSEPSHALKRRLERDLQDIEIEVARRVTATAKLLPDGEAAEPVQSE